MPRPPAWLIGLAIITFIIGSAPWWIFDFTHDHAALSTYLTNRQGGEFEGIGLPYVPPTQRALGLFLVGLPALVGLRFPWESGYFLLPVGVIVLLIYAAAFYRVVRGKTTLLPDVPLLLSGMIVLFCGVFVASSFGADPTGRYFLPLVLPLAIMLGSSIAPQFAADQKPALKWFAAALIAIVLIYNAAGQITAARSSVGITTQFDLISHIPNDHDTDLIAFLDQHGIYHGYSNYWVTFRLAFLSGERMQFSAALPYKESLDYNAADNRYPPYAEATESADQIAVITTNLPALDARLEAAFAAQSITYEQTQIGAYHIYYNFSQRPALSWDEP